MTIYIYMYEYNTIRHMISIGVIGILLRNVCDTTFDTTLNVLMIIDV